MFEAGDEPVRSATPCVLRSMGGWSALPGIRASADPGPFPLPAGDWSSLQRTLWEKHQIEVPIVNFEGRWYIRVSCHLYIRSRNIDILVRALQQEISKEKRS